jgi:ABC-type lipoprotein export system ATPase subunit
MIQTTGVTKTFSTDSGDIIAVDDISLTVNPGDFILIPGRSGNGKSTFPAILAGLTRQTVGVVRIHGNEIGNFSADKTAEVRAKEIGFVFQFSNLIPTITALENVMLPTLFFPKGPGSRSRAAGLLKKPGLPERADAYPATLPGGEMKRVALARAFINAPPVLIADEPTGDLDVGTMIEIMEHVKDLNREGTTIVMVTHNPDLAPYASQVFGMVKGKLVANPVLNCASTAKGGAALLACTD